MEILDRIIRQSGVMNGKACIRNMRVTVGMIVHQIGAGHSIEEILADYSYLEREGILQAFRYAALRLEKREFEFAAVAEIENGALITIDLNKTRLRVLPLNNG